MLAFFHEMDPSLFISLCALALSVLSPVISSILNGIFMIKERKMEIKANQEVKRLEFYDKHRAEVIEKYINAVGKYSRSDTFDDKAAFGETMGEVYLYVDESLWPLLDTISDKIMLGKDENPSKELIELCKALSDDHIRSKE